MAIQPGQIYMSYCLYADGTGRGKIRPVLVLSLNENGTVNVVESTSNPIKNQTLLKEIDFKTRGYLQVKSMHKSYFYFSAIKTNVDVSELERFVCNLRGDHFKEIVNAINVEAARLSG